MNVDPLSLDNPAGLPEPRPVPPPDGPSAKPPAPMVQPRPWQTPVLVLVMVGALGVITFLLAVLLVTTWSSPADSSPRTRDPLPQVVMPPPTDTGYEATRVALAEQANRLAEDANALARLLIPTPYPTATAAAIPTSTVLPPECSTPEPGQDCQWPRPTFTPSPVEVCTTPNPGVHCWWPTAAPSPSPSPASPLSTTSNESEGMP